MAVTTQGQITEALDANLNSLHQDGLDRHVPEYTVIYNVLNSTKSTERETYESGFGAMPEKPEGTPVTYSTIIPGIAKNFVMVSYGLGYEITEEAIDDNLRTQDTFNKFPELLAASGMETVEVTSANIFNNGFTDNGFDGVPLFSTSHPKLGGGTHSNKPAVDADLSVTTLTAGFTAIDQYTDEMSLTMKTKAATLAVAPDNWNIIFELLQSDYKPYTANNERNALMTKNVDPFIWHYLTDPDAWFLIAEKTNHNLKFYWRKKPGRLRRGNDFDTFNLKHVQSMRFDVDYSHHKGTYGSSGG